MGDLLGHRFHLLGVLLANPRLDVDQSSFVEGALELHAVSHFLAP